MFLHRGASEISATLNLDLLNNGSLGVNYTKFRVCLNNKFRSAKFPQIRSNITVVSAKNKASRLDESVTLIPKTVICR